jgi:hypothetical protein
MGIIGFATRVGGKADGQRPDYINCMNRLGARMFALILKGEEQFVKDHCCEQMTSQVNSFSAILGLENQRS